MADPSYSITEIESINKQGTPKKHYMKPTLSCLDETCNTAGKATDFPTEASINVGS